MTDTNTQENSQIIKKVKSQTWIRETEKIYLICLVVYIIGFLYFIHAIVENEKYYARHNIPTTGFSWILYAIMGAIFSKCCFIFVDKCFHDHIFNNRLIHNRLKQTPKEQIIKIKNYMHGIIYYTLIFGINFFITFTTDTSYLPKAMGGTLFPKTFIEDWPKNPPFAILFVFIFTIGHHWERIADHLINKRESPSFYIMFLHHFITIVAMIYCFYARQLKFGVPIVLLHDAGDIFLNIFKYFREIRYLKKYSLTAFFFMLICWIYTRGYANMMELILPVTFEVLPNVGAHLYKILIFNAFGMWILQILNYYWIYTMLFGMVNKLFLNKGEAMIHEGEVADIKIE